MALSTTCHRTRLCDLTQLIPLMNVKSETGYHGTIRLLRRIPAILGEKLQGFNDFFLNTILEHFWMWFYVFVSFGGQSARLIGSANQELARSEHPQMVACGATKGRPMMIHRDPASKYHRLLHRSCGLSTYFIPISIYFFVLDLHFYIHLHGISWSHGHDGRFFFPSPCQLGPSHSHN